MLVSQDCCFNPSTPMSDQDRISPYNINTISSRQAMRIKKNINLGIKYQILLTNQVGIVQQSVWGSTNKI